MLRPARTATLALVSLASLTRLLASDIDRDFSGRWVLDARGSNGQASSEPPERYLTVVQQDAVLRCSTTSPDGARVEWSYDLNGADTRYRFGSQNCNSKVKWEGSALLINTIVSAPQSFSMLDRWTLSHDRSTLTINRTTVRGSGESEGTLVYRRGGQIPTGDVAANGVLQRPPAPAAPSELVVRAGTRIPLSLRNGIDTKHSHEGDRVYLDTIYPVVINNRIVIPRGSYVVGTLTTSKPAGVVKGKGELFIRFDSLTLPNGVTRDFRSRLVSADAGHGKVDPKEGTITGERDKANEAKTTAEGAGIGAGIGGLAGAAAGHAIPGVGIGAAAGAVAGLATALGRHRPEASLPSGTVIEMLLDRDLTYPSSELGR